MTRPVILVPLDGSGFAERSLSPAVAAARVLGAALELVTVYDENPTVGVWPLAPEGTRHWSEEYLSRVADALREDPDLAVRTVVAGGTHPGRALVEQAAGPGVQLIVMSTHGRGPLARAWLGSVADHVVRHAPVPVLLVRPDEQDTAEPAGEVSFRHVLVPLDGSPLAEQALPWARKFAQFCDAGVTLLRAVPPPATLSSPYLPDTIRDTSEVLAEGRRDAEQYLAGATTTLAAEGVAVQSELLVGVRPATAILRFAERRRVDLIVIATHGRGGLARAVLGSVADKIVRGAHAPVLLVRARD